MSASRRLLWVFTGVLAAAVAALLAFWLLRDDLPADEAGGQATPSGTPSATTSTTTSTGTDVEASSRPTPEESGPPVELPPLRDPGDHLPADGVSAIPAAGEPLGDDDFVVHLTGIDLAARTVDVDVEVLYIGAAADEYLLAHDPTAEIPPPNGFVLVNDSTSVRTVPLATDVRVWDWCDGDAGLAFVERSLEEWAAAPADGDTRCTAGAALSRGSNEVYWLQVRDGEAKRVIGQYLP